MTLLAGNVPDDPDNSGRTRRRGQTVTPHRYNVPVSITESPNTAEVAARFLRSDAGRAAVDRSLATLHLPRALADDVVQDALRRVCVATAPGGEPIDNVEAFVTTVVHRAAVDIVRGRVRRPQVIDLRGVDPDAEVQGCWFTPASHLDAGADACAGEALAAVRRTIHHLLGDDPMAGAAALAYLVVTVDGGVPASDCPRPAGGATAVDEAEWVGLWYSGRRDCFEAPSLGRHGRACGLGGGVARDGQARRTAGAAGVRKRRSRATLRFRSALTAAAEAAGVRAEGAHHG